MDTSVIIRLVEEALNARENAYCPHSKFAVGAALLSKDKIYTGCNIENVSHSAAVCAERVAFYKAVSGGEKNFKAICIVGGTEGKSPESLISPCGVCRQVMAEFCGEDFIIITAKSAGEYKTYSLKELLPLKFDF